MMPVGETLRRERLKRHLELDQISQELKISARMLEAIEEEKFDRLPGGVFAKSFIRQYARLLGLDEDELVSEVQRRMEPPSSLTAQSMTNPTVAVTDTIHVPRVETWEEYGGKSFSWGGWMPAAAMVIVVMLVCSGVYGWWQRTKRLAIVPEPPPAAAQQAPDPLPTPAAAEPVAPPVPDATIASPPPEVASAERQAPPAQNTANPDAAVRVALTADEPVWVSARADGKYLFSGTLDANQTRTVEAHDTLLIRLGNAGGLTVTLNGKPLGALGAKGQARTVQFTPGGFQIVAAPKPSLPL